MEEPGVGALAHSHGNPLVLKQLPSTPHSMQMEECVVHASAHVTTTIRVLNSYTDARLKV